MSVFEIGYIFAVEEQSWVSTDSEGKLPSERL